MEFLDRNVVPFLSDAGFQLLNSPGSYLPDFLPFMMCQMFSTGESFTQTFFLPRSHTVVTDVLCSLALSC